jgi:hypothetical protein
MSRGHSALSAEQHILAAEGGEGVNYYEGPESGGPSYRSGFRTSDEIAGAAFKTKDIAHGKVLGISKRTQKGIYEFGSDTSTPTFNDAKQ